MDSALAWVGQVAEWFGKFIPRREVLDTTEGAIKFVRGNEPVYCGPGIWWWWPWSTKWEPFPMVRQTNSVEMQTLESSDGKTFLVNGMLTYEVNDLIKLMTTVHMPEVAIVEIATAAMNDVLCKLTWAKIQEEQQKGTLKTKLKNAAQNELDEYGVKVIRFKVNSLARCRVYKVSQSTASEDR